MSSYKKINLVTYEAELCLYYRIVGLMLIQLTHQLKRLINFLQLTPDPSL